MADPQFFKKPAPLTLKDILEVSGASLHDTAINPATLVVHDVAPLMTAEKDHLSFLDNAKYVEMFHKSRAGVCFVSPEHADEAPKGMVVLVTSNPYKAYALTAQKFYPNPTWKKSYMAPNAFIHPTAKIGSNCIIDHNAYIGPHVTIGSNTWIKPNVVLGQGVEIGNNTVIGSNSSLSFCKIGSNVHILAGVRIGQEGFGFAMDPSGHIPVPQLGRVIIGNSVWIGSNTTVDRGAGPDTEIGDGCMIDNLVQIGHNVKIGKYVVLVSQVGIAGSTEIEDYAVIAGQVGIAGHLKIGRAARIGAQAGVMKNVPAGAEVMGAPAIPLKDFFRQVATLSKLAKK